jgi:hypothetical protein
MRIHYFYTNLFNLNKNSIHMLKHGQHTSAIIHKNLGLKIEMYHHFVLDVNKIIGCNVKRMYIFDIKSI